MAPEATTRADLHCHSSASRLSKLGVARALGLPECATPPEEVYELAKRRGMDFVTITDHDTIDGVLEIADRRDVFVSEELTAQFAGEPQAVHILCYGITPADHEWLQGHRHDLESCAEYLHERQILSALAHPFYSVAAPLAPRHRRRLAVLFPVWEVRNGSRASELNAPAAVYVETHGGIGIGGSDDHAGVDIGRTYSEAPHAASPAEFLAHVRDGQVRACGDEGWAAKWAHAALGIASRVLGTGDGRSPRPEVVLRMVERVMREGDARSGALGADLDPRDAEALLEVWLRNLGLELRGPELLAHLQEDGFSHAALLRTARHAHERKLRAAVSRPVDTWTEPEVRRVAGEILEACLSVVPYAPAAAFLGREKAKLGERQGSSRRVALIAEGIGSMHGVTRAVEEIRARGVPGFEIDVIGTDGNVDRRLPSVAEVRVPFYRGLSVGVPALPAVVETLAEGRYDVLHLCTPGPAGIAAGLTARIMGIPVIGSYHTELGAYAGLRSGEMQLQAGVQAMLAAFYGACQEVLSPSLATDTSLRGLGVSGERIGRWERGVDTVRFDPSRRVAGQLPGALNVLYAGRLTTEKGVDLLAEAFLRARDRDQRLHLVLAGGGPEESRLRARLGAQATFLGWLEGDELATAYASADVFLFPSSTDTFGQVILEAQASGLPVVAVRQGGPADLIDDGRTGILCPADAEQLGTAVAQISRSLPLAMRLAETARASVAHRTWERALAQLAEGYGRAAGATTASIERAA